MPVLVVVSRLRPLRRAWVTWASRLGAGRGVSRVRSSPKVAGLVDPLTRSARVAQPEGV